jgi:1-acyl-sn-glycerol-3-phosphate acyltransferase
MPPRSLVNTNNLPRKIHALFVGCMLAIFLGSTLLLVNLIQTLSLVVLLFSRKAFRSVNRVVAGTWWGTSVSLAEALYGTKVVITGDTLPQGENVLAVLNHQTMADLTYVMFLARHCGSLGNLKGFSKDVVKWVPGVGWGLLFLDTVFVKRNWTQDAEAVNRTFSGLNRDEVPFWLTNFAEGTRLKPSRFAQSRKYARDNGIEPLNNVMIPRTKGFVASVEGLGRHLDAVYDITFGYPGGAPSLWQYITGVSREAHCHIRRYQADQLPHSSDGLNEWLHTKFREKDQMLEDFYQNGYFGLEVEKAETEESSIVSALKSGAAVRQVQASVGP